MLITCILFFFQAEDGIRDHCVTGVQTCALPISASDGNQANEMNDAAEECEELEAGPILVDLPLGGIERMFEATVRSEEHTSELQSHSDLVCRLLLEKKKTKQPTSRTTSTYAGTE